MELSQCFELSILILLTGIVIILSIGRKYISKVALLVIIANSILSSIPAFASIGGNIQRCEIELGTQFGGLVLQTDGLAGWFILLVNFAAVNGAIYGLSYLKKYTHLPNNLRLHWVVFPIFHLSMLWVCMVQNTIAFLISWEFMSLSSLLLVIFEYQNKDTLRAGLNYLVQMHISVVMLTIGFIWLFFNTHSFQIQALANLPGNQHNLWIFILLFTGFAIKAGFLPFHTWLPKAHPAAPSHVSGVMSGVIVKMGIFGILRIISYMETNWLLIGEVVLSLSILTAIYGIANAAVSRDVKRMLAFCTIENIGIIGIGISLGLIGRAKGSPGLEIIGFTAALLHSLNHSLYKTLLFFCSGDIYTFTHSRNSNHLGGLVKKIPFTAFMFLFGSLAIVGLPPLNGFISEYLLYNGLFNSFTTNSYLGEIVLFVLCTAGLALTAGLSLLAFTKNFGIIFLGNPRKKIHNHPIQNNFLYYLPFILLSVAILVIALFPKIVVIPAMYIVKSVLSKNLDTSGINLDLLTNIQHVGWVGVLFILSILLVYFIRKLLTKKQITESYETWSCGYVGQIPKAQYTGNSYIRSLSQLFGFLTKENKNVQIEKQELFPGKHSYASKYVDVIEKYIVNKAAKRIAFLFHYFKFIQNGQIQSYVIYGLLFLILIYLLG